MKEYLDEEEYLEDIYGDEIKVGDGFYLTKEGNPIHEKNLIEYLLDTHDLRRRER